MIHLNCLQIMLISSMCFPVLHTWVSFFILLTQTNNSLSSTECLYHRELHIETQTNSAQHHPPVTSSSIKIEFIISVHHVGKAANSKWNNIVKLSKQCWCECWLWGSGTDCLIKAAFSLSFFGFQSSALDWSESSGQRLRCIQNYNASSSIV